MKLIMDLAELYRENFTKRDPKYTLDAAMKFWTKAAASRSIRSELLELAINRGFSRLAQGEKFPEQCPCGCGIDGAGTSFTHAVLADLLLLDKDLQTKTSELINDRFRVVVEAQMKRVSKTNKDFIKMNRPPLGQRIKKWIGLQS